MSTYGKLVGWVQKTSEDNLWLKIFLQKDLLDPCPNTFSSQTGKSLLPVLVTCVVQNALSWF